MCFARRWPSRRSRDCASLAVGAASPSLPPLPPVGRQACSSAWPIRPATRPRCIALQPFGFRYQYLAGGVNTGSGWATWNPTGSFVTRYDTESWAAGMIPVYSYYQLLQSKPAEPGGEDAVDLAHLDDPATMAAYWSDVRLFLRAGARDARRSCSTSSRTSGATSNRPRAATTPQRFRRSCRDDLPQTAAGFAQEFLRLRDALAPNVILAYHMSGWGTKHDIVYEKPPAATVRAYAARSAAFYRSLGRALRRRLRGLLRPRRRLLPGRRAQPEHVVQAGRLRAASALCGDVRAPGRASGWWRGRSRSETP